MIDWASLPRSDDISEFDGSSPPVAPAADLAEVIDRLASPDDGSSLRLEGEAMVSGVGQRYPVRNGRPVLLPVRALARLNGDAIAVPPEATGDAFDQYLYMAQVKNTGGDANLPLLDPWYRRHLHRSAQLVRDAQGMVLDIGCDDPQLSRRLFPASARYLGLEPALGRNPGFRIVGMAEFLPFRDDSLDAAAFLTSLDHVLDYHAAVDEAFRVLRPGGALYLGTLVWTHRAGLHNDNIHFHHFRDFEVQGALRRFSIARLQAYGWKGDAHRYGVYLKAIKPGGAGG